METSVNPALLRVSLRYKGVCIVNPVPTDEMTPAAAVLLERLIKCGYICEESLARAINALSEADIDTIALTIEDILGLRLNWAPLVKGWLRPTGETRLDHLVTLILNIFPNTYPGTTLPCGHFIPEGTFPLERYNGCPFCGRQFETSTFHYTGQGSRLKPLRLMTQEDMLKIYMTLLESPIPLDATALDSAVMLSWVFGIPADAEIGMKETIAALAEPLIKARNFEELSHLFRTPTDVMRYLWSIHTGQERIVRPHTLIRLEVINNRGAIGLTPQILKRRAKRNLKLHYTRSECRLWAEVLNRLPISPAKAAEIMNPQRGMWVRFIRALRLTEAARRPGMEHLAAILDHFYNKSYFVWAGQVDEAINTGDAKAAFMLLEQRPGQFARRLFSTMLRLGDVETIGAFSKVVAGVPMRLLMSLLSSAEIYFTSPERLVRPVAGQPMLIPANPLLANLSIEQRLEMVSMISSLVKSKIIESFASRPAPGVKIHIAPQLYDAVVAVGDRSATVQDTQAAVQGMRFPLEGDKVRLFMQWGKGLPAQHLDMDLSAQILFSDGSIERVSYYSLSIDGGCHSGDIREIPDYVGTAEYVELDVARLAKRGARYAVFTCNAYSGGDISPNLTVGWMDSAYEMKVSEETGVAYDPSTVIFQTRVPDKSYMKGLVFGLLDIAMREILWLEMPFSGQITEDLNLNTVRMLLERLKARPKLGDCLEAMAQARGMIVTADPAEADEVYDDPFTATALLLS